MLRVYFLFLHIGVALMTVEEERFNATAELHAQRCPEIQHPGTCPNVTNVDDPIEAITSGSTLFAEMRRVAYSSVKVKDEDVSGSDSCCGFCNCEPDCAVYGSCCPVMYGSFEAGKAIVDESRFICAKPKYIDDVDKTDFIGSTKKFREVWLVGKCKPSISAYLDQQIETLCLNPGSDNSVHSVTPVTDGTFHYRNKYCGLCNGKSFNSLTSWKLRVACGGVVSSYGDNILETIEEKRCNIFYMPPTTVPVKKCYMPPYSISKCNVTGHWKEYNETIDKACSAFLDPFNGTYRNYFCYLCNKPEVVNKKCYSKEDITDLTPPFTALINVADIGDKATLELPECDVLEQFWDYKMMKCRDIECHEDRYLSELQCLLQPNHTDKCYQVFVKLIPGKTEEYLGLESVQLIAKALIDTVSSKYVTVREYQIYIKLTDDDGSTFINYAVVEILVEVRQTTETDTIADIIDKLQNKIFDKYVAELVSYRKTATSETTLYVVDSNNSVVDKLAPMYLETILDDESDASLCSEKGIFLFSKILICPFIQIGMDEWHTSTKNDILAIEKGQTHITFSKWEYEQNAYLINICLEDFQSVHDALPSKIDLSKRNDSLIGPKQIVAFVCVIMSLVSLLITIFAYARFSVLQSQPGMNNVVLCICLFLAQSMYQFGAGQRSVSYWECSVIGAFCHFFWLSVMFSMNSCSVQMFLIFKHSMKLTPKFRWKVTLKHLLYIILLSFAFVAINVIVSVIRSGGTESGYGGNVCYISSHVMHLITFMLPTSCTIIANISFFTYVVFKIEKSIISSTKMNLERNYFGVYVRLSTLTGLTWIFGVILLFVESDVVEYLFIISNASQGVLIMVAFVVNQRVFSLCRKKKDISQSSDHFDSNKSLKAMAKRTLTKTEIQPMPSTSSFYSNGVIVGQMD